MFSKPSFLACVNLSDIFCLRCVRSEFSTFVLLSQACFGIVGCGCLRLLSKYFQMATHLTFLFIMEVQREKACVRPPSFGWLVIGNQSKEDGQTFIPNQPSAACEACSRIHTWFCDEGVYWAPMIFGTIREANELRSQSPSDPHFVLLAYGLHLLIKDSGKRPQVNPLCFGQPGSTKLTEKWNSMDPRQYGKDNERTVHIVSLIFSCALFSFLNVVVVPQIRNE